MQSGLEAPRGVQSCLKAPMIRSHALDVLSCTHPPPPPQPVPGYGIVGPQEPRVWEIPKIIKLTINSFTNVYPMHILSLPHSLKQLNAPISPPVRGL